MYCMPAAVVVLVVLVTGMPRFDIVFNPGFDPPDRIPPQRFNLRCYTNTANNNLLDCRHGRILFEDLERREVIVCDPITGEKHCVAVPPEYEPSFRPSAVLCAATASDQGHVHGACHYSPFKVVLMYSKDNHLLVCVYSSQTDTWGNHISTAAPCKIYDASYSGSLIGNTLYWLCTGDRILEFDMDGQSLPMIEGTVVANDLNNASRKIMQADNGDVGLAILSYPYFQMWQRDLNYHGVMRWVLQKTIDISIILGLPPLIEARLEEWKTIEGYTEDAIFLCVGGSLYMVQLDSMKSKRLQESDNFFCCRPFTSFYAPGDCSFSHVSYMVAEMSLFFFLCHDNKSLVTSVPQHNCQMSENIKSNVNE
uniref:F-box protein AT5G49610-like beta-propeller domain-containing protein n=1 Tax=Triticum aestivum TaxID=4565 RepID=A0A077RTS2_WHEAT|nr:unnamed protein product [Triticum aestivum]